MNEQDKSDPNQTTILKLNQFVPGQPLAGAADQNGPAETVMIVRQAAQDVCKQGQQPVVAPKEGNTLSAQSLLGVVSYCYAKGVFTSEDIQRKLHHDPALKAACGDNLPDSGTIRRFRRLNRQNILATLERLFRFRRKQASVAAAAPTLDPNASSDAKFPATYDAGESTIMVARSQAQERLDQAAFIDNMSKE